MKTLKYVSRLMVVCALFISVTPARSDGWMWYCDYYDSTNFQYAGCNGSVPPNCTGTCSQYATISQDCGVCSDSFNPFTWCYNSSPPTYVLFYTQICPCSTQTSSDGETVTGYCGCGGPWTDTGTIYNGCYCY
jgi:hypothetical protein